MADIMKRYKSDVLGIYFKVVVKRLWMPCNTIPYNLYVMQSKCFTLSIINNSTSVNKKIMVRKCGGMC